jgi:oleate hydratase
MQTQPDSTTGAREAYIVGGGIAGLAAAAFLIRDGGMAGRRIHLLEASDRIGGSLDGAGDPQSGYVIRGGRMFETHFACTYDLLSTVPSLTDPRLSVSEELHAFTRRIVTSSKSRLVVDGRKIEAPPLNLSLRDKWDLARLTLLPERTLGRRSIEQYFAAGFFSTNFWLMWCTMFAFQPWHSLAEFRRYMRRFMHLMPGFNRLEGIHRTPYNQYDSIIRPLVSQLEQAGVDLQTHAAVLDIDFAAVGDGKKTVSGILLEQHGHQRRIDIRGDDLVLITLGSMTEGSDLGTMDSAPTWRANPEHGAWALWRKISRQSDAFGNPDVFCSDVDKSRWESFTVTLRDPFFFDFMEKFTGNAAGTGGLVTFTESSWLLSVVLAYQPHFANQPEDVNVFWGYGLRPERRGNHIDKPMTECSGREILTELFHHLPVGDSAARIIDAANCIPCAMPYITSQFMPRTHGDRPAVVPDGASNFAFLGQYCEAPEDTVFTVEYSVRTAQMAVCELLGLTRKVTPIYRGYLHPSVVLRALRAMA